MKGAPPFEVAWKFILRWQRAAHSQQQHDGVNRSEPLLQLSALND
jgi:hypothetical protein